MAHASKRMISKPPAGMANGRRWLVKQRAATLLPPNASELGCCQHSWGIVV